MLFLTYWELNENTSVAQREKSAASVIGEGHFPPDGIEILRWDITPDGWGILVTEADSPEAVQNALTVWRASVDGFFNATTTAPAVPVTRAMANTRELLDALG